MEGVGSEVSQKIRAAIKAKLVELGAYVDDELPDYIMVMVANKRSRSQMEEDLSLFLNNNTKIFTAWLHSVLKKLQEVTVAANEQKAAEIKKVTKRKRSSSSDSPARESDDRAKLKKKKHKEKKTKKKRKGKEANKVKNKGKKARSSDGSDSDQEVPKKKAKDPKEIDVSKEVEQAILGDVKERQKPQVTVQEAPVEETSAESNKVGQSLNLNKDVAVDGAKQEDVVDAVVPVAESSDAPPQDLLKPAIVLNKEDIAETSKEDGSENIITTNQNETVILAPTRELLREHDKLTSKSNERPIVNIDNGDKVAAATPAPHVPSDGVSDGTMSPEEMRRQLLLSRAKRKMEQRGLDSRMRSNSPEVVFLEEKPAATIRVADEERLAVKKTEVPKRSPVRLPPRTRRVAFSPSSSARRSSSTRSTRGSVSSHRRDSTKKAVKRNLSSHIVTPRGPNEPDIQSVVKVKPREFAPADKQANKALVLKAVAAAERSVASAPIRKIPDDIDKKPKALFTKDLREKRETLAVTLTNDRRHQATSKAKREKDSITQPTEKKDVEGPEENFISSKTLSKDANTSYIQCWLEGVEKAGECNDLIKPDEIDDIPDRIDNATEGDSNLGHGNDALEAAQIVVTVDGLHSVRDSAVRSRNDSKILISKKKDVNRISDRFARISKPAEEHEYKEKYQEFERQRLEKKLSREGGSKNQRLIAELSQKFGKLDRDFNDRRDVGSRQTSDPKSRNSKRLLDETKPAKSKEQCRFWPDCGKGDSCEFIHPSSTCKLLPNCKFKDKCVYVHPLCKQDPNCTSRDCSYKHTRSRSRRSPETSRGKSKYDRSSKVSDSHIGRKFCRYGSRCNNRDCNFLHPRKGSMAC